MVQRQGTEIEEKKSSTSVEIHYDDGDIEFILYMN